MEKPAAATARTDTKRAMLMAWSQAKKGPQSHRHAEEYGAYNGSRADMRSLTISSSDTEINEDFSLARAQLHPMTKDVSILQTFQRLMYGK